MRAAVSVALFLVGSLSWACTNGDPQGAAQGQPATSSEGPAAGIGGCGTAASADGSVTDECGAATLEAGAGGEGAGVSDGCAGPPLGTNLLECEGGRYLALQALEGDECRYALLELQSPADPVTAVDLIVTVRSDSGEGEMGVLIPGLAEACARVPNDPAWFFDPTVDPPEVGFCPCSCAHLAGLLAEGKEVRVLFGCGGGPLYMG